MIFTPNPGANWARRRISAARSSIFPCSKASWRWRWAGRWRRRRRARRCAIAATCRTASATSAACRRAPPWCAFCGRRSSSERHGRDLAFWRSLAHERAVRRRLSAYRHAGAVFAGLARPQGLWRRRNRLAAGRAARYADRGGRIIRQLTIAAAFATVIYAALPFFQRGGALVALLLCLFLALSAAMPLLEVCV